MTRMSVTRVGAAAMVLSLALGASDASAQVIGTFKWRLSAFCNVVTLTIVQQGPAILAAGSDDNCGLSNPSPVNGTFFLAGGTALGGLTIIESDGTSSSVRVQLSVSSLSGTWSDDSGHSGSFVFNPAAAPGDRRPIAKDAWAYVVGSGPYFHASSGNLTLTRPSTGEYCLVVAKRYSHKAAQVTLADPGGTKIVSVGTGHGSACNPLNTETEDAIPVYIKTTAGVAVNGNFTIVIPAR